MIVFVVVCVCRFIRECRRRYLTQGGILYYVHPFTYMDSEDIGDELCGGIFV